MIDTAGPVLIMLATARTWTSCPSAATKRHRARTSRRDRLAASGTRGAPQPVWRMDVVADARARECLGELASSSACLWFVRRMRPYSSPDVAIKAIPAAVSARG